MPEPLGTAHGNRSHRKTGSRTTTTGDHLDQDTGASYLASKQSQRQTTVWRPRPSPTPASPHSRVSGQRSRGQQEQESNTAPGTGAAAGPASGGPQTTSAGFHPCASRTGGEMVPQPHMGRGLRRGRSRTQRGREPTYLGVSPDEPCPRTRARRAKPHKPSSHGTEYERQASVQQAGSSNQGHVPRREKTQVTLRPPHNGWNQPTPRPRCR